MKKANTTIDLFEQTIIKDIPYHYGMEEYSSKKHDRKFIAADIRTHLRKRFPMCKWSIRKTDYSVYVDLKSSPWEHDSNEVERILAYAKAYASSWNYDNSDPYTDYYDTNFYLFVRVDQYDYSIKEYEGAETISDLFNSKLADELKRLDEEREREYRRMEHERLGAAKREMEERCRAEALLSSVEAKECDVVLHGCISSYSKPSTVEEALEELVEDRVSCHVVREVRMTNEQYECFSRRLLDDHKFLSFDAQVKTENRFINSYMDTNYYDGEYTIYNECASIIVDDEVKLLVRPHSASFPYVRECYFIDSETEEMGDSSVIVPDDGLTDEEANKMIAHAEEAVKIARAEIGGSLEHIYDGDDVRAVYDRFKRTNFKLTINDCLMCHYCDEKVLLYRVYGYTPTFFEQVKDANLQKGQHITLFIANHFTGAGFIRESYVFDRIVDRNIVCIDSGGRTVRLCSYDKSLLVAGDVSYHNTVNKIGISIDKEIDELFRVAVGYMRDNDIQIIANTHNMFI